MVEKIKIYLEQPVDERDYDEGLLLLTKASKNRILIQRLSRKEWPEKLFYELQKFLDHETAVIEYKKTKKADKAAVTRAANKLKKEQEARIKAEEEAKNKEDGDDDPLVFQLPNEFSEESKPARIRVVKENQTVNFDNLPVELQAKWTENANMYKEGRSLHEKLKLMAEATDEDRKPVITRLSQLSEAIRANWDAIDNYDPTAAPKEKIKVVVDHKRINSNRKYISSNLKKLEKEPKNTVLFAKIQERVSELIKAGHQFSADQELRLKNLKFEMGAPGK